MAKKIKSAFDITPIKVSLKSLEETAPRRNYKELSSYYAILSSIREVGILQPITVCRAKIKDKYKILDGHLRYYALKELGISETYCILSLDDERYTFDAQINFLNPLQKAKMISKAVKSGLSPDRIAQTLNLDTKKIISDMNISDGIDDKVRDILKSSPVSSGALRQIKKVKPLRQIAIAETMIASNNFCVNFVRGLILASQKSMLINPDEKPKKKFLSRETLTSLNDDRVNIQTKVIEAKKVYSENIFDLTNIASFLKKILSNNIISSYIDKHFNTMYEELLNISKINEID